MKALIVLLAAIPLVAFGVDLGEHETAHGVDYVNIFIDLLAFIGGSSVAAAFIPSKVRTAVPVLNMLLNFVSANFLNAKNKTDPE